jgi:DNA topoisomerase-1
MNKKEYIVTLKNIDSKKEFCKEKAKLVIKPMGLLVAEFVNKHFSSLFDYGYTKAMENGLDKVATNNADWTALCAACLQDIEESSQQLLNEKRVEIPIDDCHALVMAKYGPVVKCTTIDDKNRGTGTQEVTFKGIRHGIDLDKVRRGEYKLDDILSAEQTGSIGVYKGEPLFVKKGKYGLYAMWGTNKKSLSCFGNRPVENIRLEDVVEVLDKMGETASCILRRINDSLSLRTGPYGDYLYYKTPKMKKPMFFKLAGFKEDPRTCHIDLLKSWTVDTYQIRL